MNTALNHNNYPTYNIGDKVTIRQWEDMESEFGLNEYGEIKVPKCFTEPMKQYCGQTLSIVHVRRHAPPTVVLRFFLPPCLNNLMSAPPLSPSMIY